MKSTIGQETWAEKIYREIGYDPMTGEFRNPPKSPVSSRILPFRIRAIEKTKRQWNSDQGYKASGAWQTASLLRDLLLLWTNDHLSIAPGNLGTLKRLRTQMEDAGRSMVSTFEEGWARPSTKEFLDFIGFSQASLTELRGDFERCLTDGLISSNKSIRSMTQIGIPTPSRTFPYPPVSSRKSPTEYGTLREKLREFTGNKISSSDLTFEIFLELINKTSYLFKRTVEGLWNKLSHDEQVKLKETLATIWH